MPRLLVHLLLHDCSRCCWAFASWSSGRRGGGRLRVAHRAQRGRRGGRKGNENGERGRRTARCSHHWLLIRLHESVQRQSAHTRVQSESVRSIDGQRRWAASSAADRESDAARRSEGTTAAVDVVCSRRHRERRRAIPHASMRTRQRVHSTTTPRRLLHWRCSLRRRRCWPPQLSCACARFTQKELPSNAHEHSYIPTNRCLRPRRDGAGGNVQGHCAAASPSARFRVHCSAVHRTTAVECSLWSPLVLPVCFRICCGAVAAA